MTTDLREDDAVVRAIATERGHVGVQINRARVGVVGAWCVMALSLGLAGRPEWLVPLPILAVVLAIATALEIAARRADIASYLWLATPLLDVPFVGLVQLRFIAVSIRPEAVAIFTVAMVASLVFVSQLSFARRGIIATLIGALVFSMIILSRAHLPLPNMLSAALLLAWAAVVAAYASSRVKTLVSSIAREQRSREAELEALVATRTEQLAGQNQKLETRQIELETALRSLAAAQADLVRAERMASVATLVKGIAHELNNPINYIAGNIPPLERYVRFVTEAATQLSDGSPRSREAMQKLLRLDAKRDLKFVTTDLSDLTRDIAEGARRAKLIVGDLQSLTLGYNREVEDVNLGRVLEQTRSLFAPRLPSGVLLTIEVYAPNAIVRARAGQLEQVLVNLVDNAIRASGEKGHVVMRLTGEAETARIVVRDEGVGMTDEQLARACEPFFTTRVAGEGSGLGLAIVAQIVEAHGGQLSIDSAPGRGTSVSMSLPTNASSLQPGVSENSAPRDH